MYACSVCGGTEAIRACKVAGSLVSASSGSSTLSPSMTSPGEGVSIGPAGGDKSDPAGDGRSLYFNCEDDKSIDGAGVCCCFGGNWKCCSVSVFVVASVVEGPASTTETADSDLLEKNPNTIGDGG